ncbi:hypothetical protein [uncultured Draconibacterium sp.]|uniref:hypothetical protein n=1 Tax=uncultured Draconibacterium sp. TaxID=1573823 RepID=UPI0032604FC5
MTIVEFVEILYKERKILDIMFRKRQKSVFMEQLLPLVDYDNEKIDFLVQQEILLKIGNTIALNDLIKDFLEKFTNVAEEINNEYTEGLLNNLRSNIEKFNEERRIDKKDEYLVKIKTDLRKIGHNIIANINQIRKNINDAYVTEKNIKIRKIVIDENDNKAKQIERLITDIQNYIRSNEWEFFRKNADDNTLDYIATDLFKKINIAWRNLTDIIQNIIDFHNLIRIQTEAFKKLQKVKQLKDNGTIKEYSNIEHVVQQENALFYQEQQRFDYNVSIPFLQSDEGYNAVAKVQTKIAQTQAQQKSKVAEEVSELNTDSKEDKINAVNVAQLKQIFTSGSGELFDFINNYEFEYEMTFDEKVTLFCKIASLYSDEFEQNGFNTEDDIEYAVLQTKKQ